MNDLILKHCTVHFRIWDGHPEMILENGVEGCFVVGEIELRQIVREIEQVLTLAMPHHEGGGI